MAIQTLNPATGQIEKIFQPESVAQLDEKISQAMNAYHGWKKISIDERVTLMKRLSSHLKDNLRKYASVVTKEMGRPILHSDAEIEKAAAICDYYVENAKSFLTPEDADIGATYSHIQFDPLGLILGVMPWNYPFTQAFRPAIPAILAGNVFILKHASNVPQSSLLIQEAFEQAGFPPGVFTSVLVESRGINHLIADDRIAAVTVTGSERAGASVAAKAGEHLKKTVLELGGSDAFIVFADADIDETVSAAVKARLTNAGQACNSPKRIILDKSIASEFTSKFVQKVAQMKIGDPMNEDTDIGPITRDDLRSQLHRQVKDSVAKGARLLHGGEKIDRPGFFYEVTVLDNVKKGMPVFDEEVFGPVAVFIEVESEEEAIQVANDSHLGLSASIWTKDVEKAKKYIDELEVGLVYINQPVRSNPALPYGGIKKSGYGRELGKYGIREFTNVKSVVIK